MNLHKDNDTSFRERIDAVKQIVDPLYVVENLGFKIESETVKEVRCACVVHGGDNKTAFKLNKDLKTWCCFTHKCNEQFGNDMFGLVRAVNNCGFMEALTYLEELTGSVGVSKDELVAYKRKRERQEFIRLNNVNGERPSVVDEERLKYYKPYRSSFFIDEGFDSATLDYFEIAGGYSDNDGLVRDIIPIYDDNDVLVAYSLRDIRRNVVDTDKKYILTPGFDKSSVLYNLNKAKAAAHLPLIIVEGFKSVWRLYELGIHNVVACIGAGISKGQADLLCTYAPKGVVLFLDNDKAGMEGVTRSYELLKNKVDIFMEIITETDEDGKGLDPADLSKEQLMYYLNNYKE